MTHSHFIITLTILLLIPLVFNQACIQYTQTSCQINNCIWNNGTCSLGNPTCLSGQVFSTFTNKCQSCSALAQNECTSLCSSFYFSTSCKSCADYDFNCIQCSEIKCTGCATNFILNSNNANSQCNPSPCGIDYCSSCISSTTCLNCKTGYMLNVDGTSCVSSSANINNCLLYLNNTACAKCLTGYSLSSDYSTCTIICNDANCQTCTTPSSCTSCKTNYQFSTTLGFCKLKCLISTCDICDLANTCRICVSGYQPNALFTDCIPVCLDTNCATCTTPSNCTRCIVGFTLNSNNACVRTICNINGCSTCLSVSTCDTCGANYNKINSTHCQGKCITSTNNCIDCASTTECSACASGYKLANNLLSCVPMCSINNCGVCQNSLFCKFCQEGYELSSNRQTCVLACGVRNCLTCNTTTTCGTCVSPFVPIRNGVSCALTCTLGFFLSSSGVCTLCSSSISNCNTCSLSSSNSVICSSCQTGYFLSGSNACIQCSLIISNCVSCSSPQLCTNCQSGFNLVPGTVLGSIVCASSSISCSVSNCRQCSTSDPTTCASCNDAYTLSANKKVCNKVVCVDTQLYNPLTVSCQCPVGFYLSQKKCKACDINNCISCDSAGCLSCRSSYYPLLGKCASCIKNCQSCVNGNTCDSCQDGYKYINGQCKKDRVGRGNDDDGTPAVCPGGCQSCNIVNKKLVSCVPAEGYSLDVNGNIVKCVSPCKTCARNNPSSCTSCQGATTLLGNVCKGCTDAFSTSCSSDGLYSIDCVAGYSSFNGLCKQCGDNCISCGNSGAGFCDICSPGYVVLVQTKNCTICYKACASCSNINPGLCLSCGPSDYLNATIGACLSCPSICATCTSATTCTSCIAGYVLTGSTCYTALPFPCSSQNALTCTACYAGYTFASGTCISKGCNDTKTCVNCPESQYLKQSQCFNCQTDATCKYCETSTPSNCLSCITGYYVNSNKKCISCSASMVGCADCSEKRCTLAADGYFLARDIKGRLNGDVKACKASCKTCSNYQNCNICANNYIKLGGKCIKPVYVQTTIIFLSGAGTPWFKNDTISTIDNNTNLAFAFIQSNQVVNSIAKLSKQNTDNVLLLNLFWGSLGCNSTIQCDCDNPQTVIDNINTNIKDNQIIDFRIAAFSGIPSFTNDSSSVNLGLILGLTIPLIILLAFLIILCKVLYVGGKDQDKTTQESNKEIVEDDF